VAIANKFDQFVADVNSKVHNLGSDQLNVMLTNTTPLRTYTQRSNIVEIAAGNGYTAGGSQAALVSAGQVGGIYTLILSDAVFTASGGSIGPFRYAVLYNFTAVGASYPLICWFDYLSNITIANGQSFDTMFNQTTGVFQDQ
jgi:hypothetical protein